MVELLTAQTVLPYLHHRGVAPDTATATELSGGVSNTVIDVTWPDGALVFKQSLDRLRVKDEWLAPQTRILAEAAALVLTHELTPPFVPTLLDVDDAQMTLCLQRAPTDWTDWKQRLLRGDVTPQTGGQLGTILGQWQTKTDRIALPEQIDSQAAAFESLRLSPYHRTVAERIPDVAAPVLEVAAALANVQRCFVHGDFSPKNVLVAPIQTPTVGLWVLDMEVAHRGHPHFDVAFLIHHLLMKAVLLPEHHTELAATAAAFNANYDAEVGQHFADISGPPLSHHVGALLVARIAGKSPVDYLDDTGRRHVRALGIELLTGADLTTAPAMFDLLLRLQGHP